MKNTVLKLSAGILLAALLSGCSWKVPQKISVKTKSEYNFTVAKLEKDLGSFIGLDVLKSVVPENSGLYVYEYNPALKSPYKQFLIKKNIATVPVNLSQYMTEITQDVAPVSQKISVPEISLNQSISIDADAMSADLSGNIKFAGMHPATSTASISGETDNGEIFKYFEYESGEMNIYLAKRAANPENPKVVNLGGSVSLYNNDDFIASGIFEPCNETETISLDEVSENVTLYYKASVPLAGQKVYMNGMKVKFDGVESNSALSNPENGIAFFCGEISSDAKISKASGVTVTDYIVPVSPQTITDILPAGVKALTVGEGNLSVQTTLPSAWTGVSLGVSYVTSGALTITDGKEGKTTLADKEITTGDITFTPSIKLNISNGDIDFSETPSVEIAVTAKKIKSLTVNPVEMGIETEQSVTPVPLPTDVTDIVKEIWFGASEFAVKARNTLPAGNDISITCKSDLLGLADGNITLTAGGSDVTKTLVATAQDPSGAGTVTTGKEVDFSAVVGLPGANGSEATFVNLEAGKEYEIYIEVKPDVKWSKMSLDMDALGGHHIEDSFDTGISFAGLTSKLQDVGQLMENIKFTELPVYLYCQKPAMTIFDNLQIKGKICVEGDKAKYLLGSDSTPGIMEYAEVPDLVINENGVATVDLPHVKSSSFIDLAETLTFKDNNNLKIAYNLDMTGTSGTVTVTPEDVGQSGNLEVSAYISIPMSLTVTKDSVLDVMKVANKTGDLLGRSEGYDIEKYSQYLAAIDEAAIILDVGLPLDVGEKSLKVNLDLYSESTDENRPKVTTLDLKGGEVKMTGEEIEYLLTHLTSPKADIVVPAGKMALSNEMKIKATLGLRLKTDGKVQLFEFN